MSGDCTGPWRGVLDPSETEPTFAAAIAASLDAVILFEADGRVVEFNPAAERILGYERSEAIGRPVVDLIVPPHLRKGPGLPRLVAREESALLRARADTEVLTKDGTVFPGELAVTELVLPGRRLFSATLRNLRRRGTRQELEYDPAAARARRRERQDRHLDLLHPETRAVWYSDRSH